MLICRVIKFYLLFINFFITAVCFSQDYKVYGKVTNTKLEPLAFVTITIKSSVQFTTTKEDGSYQIFLENGKYELLVSLVGFTKQQFIVTINKADAMQNIILEEDKTYTKEAVNIIGVRRDRAEEYIRNIIRNKDKISGAFNNYTASIYIKAMEENTNKKLQKVKKNKKDSIELKDTANRDFKGMSMAEIQMQLDFQPPNKIKETRNGIKKRGNPESLFYLSSTEGDFSLYNNLLQVKGVSITPFLSPVSYSGLVAYKYKTVRIRNEAKRTIYTISFKPTKLGNALLQGELEIIDSVWVIKSASFALPKYHLVEYDNFWVEQEYDFIKDTAWMLSKQKFIYNAKEGKNTKNGYTNVFYNTYSFNQNFPKKHFGLELSTTIQAAYDKDSAFWETVRTEPLSDKELRFIRYKDSIFQATNTKAYLDSIDAITNKITVKKILLDGITFYDRRKERTIFIGSVANLYEPFSPGGARIGYNFNLSKTYKNKKDFRISTNFDYGIRNKDLNGNIGISRMYNPFNRGFYYFDFGRSFDQLFEGDALINSFQKRNLYRKYHFTIGHGVEIKNGLFMNNEIEMAYRQSLSGFKFWNKWDELIQDSAFLALNKPLEFEEHGAFYNNISLSYTPFQRFLREPNEKVILGSKWPTAILKWRKGIPGLIKSSVDFDYIELRIQQKLQLGTVGISEYSFVTGKFLNQIKVELPDKKYIRGRDPYLFLYPQGNFQHMDSTFSVSRGFYEGHYVHEFNGAIFNKIPLLKKLKLREVAGGGFLIAVERNLRYFEAFAGIESPPIRILTEKFKLGVFIVGSVANQFKNPVQIKLSIRQWDKRGNRWL